MINPDILLARKIREIRKRAKQIQDTWDKRYDTNEEEFEEEEY